MYEYLKEKYGEGHPIFIRDVEIEGYNKNAIRQQFHNLVKAGKLNYYGKGVYYLGDRQPMFRDVLKGKYMTDGDNIYGYWGGLTLENMVHLTEQVPMRPQIVSNKATNAKRQVEWDKFRFTIARPRTEVTKDNYKTLQFLDIVTEIDSYGEEATSVVLDFAVNAKLTKEDIAENIKYYPQKTYKNMIDRGIYEKLYSRG